MTIGERIQSLRENANMSQRELADNIGMNYSVMNRIEADKRSVRDEELAKIADALEVTTDYLLGRTDNKNVIVCASKEESTNIEKRLLKMMVEAGKITQEEADSGVINPDVEEEIMSLLEGAIEFAEKLAK